MLFVSPSTRMPKAHPSLKPPSGHSHSDAGVFTCLATHRTLAVPLDHASKPHACAHTHTHTHKQIAPN